VPPGRDRVLRVSALGKPQEGTGRTQRGSHSLPAKPVRSMVQPDLLQGDHGLN
jgi:hypothetical protein